MHARLEDRFFLDLVAQLNGKHGEESKIASGHGNMELGGIHLPSGRSPRKTGETKFKCVKIAKSVKSIAVKGDVETRGKITMTSFHSQQASFGWQDEVESEH